MDISEIDQYERKCICKKKKTSHQNLKVYIDFALPN